MRKQQRARQREHRDDGGKVGDIPFTDMRVKVGAELFNEFDIFDNPVVRTGKDIGTAFAIGSNDVLKMAGDLGTLVTGKGSSASRAIDTESNLGQYL